MSSPDDPNNPISQFRADAERRTPEPSAGRSAADDVIEAIGDFGPTKRAPSGCPSCKGSEITTTYPVGGAARNRCGECGHKWYGGPKSVATLVRAKLGSTQTSVSGPYYKGSASLPPTGDRHQPTSRRKAKSLSGLRKKTKGE